MVGRKPWRSYAHVTDASLSVIGTCTWAIVSLRDVPSGKLPNAPPGFYPTSDVATFDQFFDSALFGVDSRCLKRGTVGYAILGKCFSLISLLERGQV